MRRLMRGLSMGCKPTEWQCLAKPEISAGRRPPYTGEAMKITKGGTIEILDNGDIGLNDFHVDCEGQTIATMHEFMLAFADCIHAALVHAATDLRVTLEGECKGFISGPKSPHR